MSIGRAILKYGETETESFNEEIGQTRRARTDLAKPVGGRTSYMLQLRSIVDVADNSGAKKVGVFKVLGGSGHRYAELGDIVVVSVKVAEPRKAVKKKEVLRAVVVRQRKPFRRKDGTYIKFDDNAVVILDGKEPKGGRIFGPIPREIKERGFNTIASLAEEVV